ncbi:hypothetical protein AVEN_70260-1 [Araneus ventricosus]|uniref:Uncharacterized protein n=1 Tax=Araneus ventricosus TaxID=182803 RepID=A0A4Y2GD64_ARAVE|nr:hypothetical protein AVEN_70260-1 [Araneus ventricosus]
MDSDEIERENVQTEMEDIEALMESALPRGTLETPTEYEMDDDKWHFADNVVREVFQWIKGIQLCDSETPLHESFKLTEAHKDDILDFLQQNGRELKKLVAESENEKEGWNYDDDNYLHCKRKILEEYKPENYTEKDFVRLCAGIAFVAIGNQSVYQDRDVMHDATNELHSWMKEVLKPGGTLQNSTWAEN